ncbi:MAG: CHAT domain-containing tetratricopeptide repeat protein [Chloroflexota bacterium]
MTQTASDRMPFLQDLRAEAEEISFSGDLEGAIHHIETGTKPIWGSLTSDEIGFIWRAKSRIYLLHDQYEECILTAQKSAQAYQLAYQPLEAAKSRVAEVQALGLLNRVDEARELTQLIQPVFEEYEFTIGKLLLFSNLATAYLFNWQNVKALSLLKEMRQFALEHEFNEEAAFRQNEIGLAYEQMGNYQLAKGAYEQSLEELKIYQDPTHIFLTTYNLAAVQLKLGQYETALQLIAEARQSHLAEQATQRGYISFFEAWTRMLVGEHETAATLFEIARSVFKTYEETLAYAEATIQLGSLKGESIEPSTQIEGLKLLAESAELLSNQNVSALLAETRLYQSEIFLKQGGYQEALARAIEAERLFESGGMPIQAGIAAYLIGETHLKQGSKVADAQTAFERAYAQLEILPSDIAIGVLHGLGRCKLQQKKLDEAELFLQAALQKAEQARMQLSRHEHQAEIGGMAVEIGQTLIKLYHMLPNDDQVDQRIINIIERINASGMLSLIGSQRRADRSTIDQDLLEQRETLRRRLEQVYQPSLQPAEPLSEPAKQGKSEQQRQEIFDLSHQLKHIDEEISRELRGEQDLAIPSEKVDLSSLPVDSLIIQYYEVDEMLWLMLIDPELDQLSRHTTGYSRTEILKSWRQVMRYIAPQKEASKGSARLNKRLGRLYEMLLGSINSAIANRPSSRLIIIPTVDLWEIPFAALYHNEAGQYLSQQRRLSLSLNLRLLSRTARPISNSPYPMLIGYAGRPEAADYLPDVAYEIAQVQRSLGSETVSFTERQALTPDIFARLQNDGPPQTLHVAAHIDFDPVDPMGSGIRLAEGQTLTAGDLYVRPNCLANTLVVLSGCDSGRVQPTGSELLGLTSGILYAGASGIISTLWPIADKAAALFMARFYRLMQQEKMTPIEALTHAQRQMMGEEGFESPYYWAAFVYIGMTDDQSDRDSVIPP